MRIFIDILAGFGAFNLVGGVCLYLLLWFTLGKDERVVPIARRKDRPVITKEMAAKMDCPFPPGDKQ